jgi:hypothetical protein
MLDGYVTLRSHADVSIFVLSLCCQAATKAKAHRVRVGLGVLLLRRDLWIDSRCRDCYGALGSQFARCAISQETHSGLFLWLGRSGRRDAARFKVHIGGRERTKLLLVRVQRARGTPRNPRCLRKNQQSRLRIVLPTVASARLTVQR